MTDNKHYKTCIMEQNLRTSLKAFKENGRFGYKNQENEVVIPCKYVSLSYFSEGLCKVEEDETFKIGYINTKGETIIPFKYLRGGDFKNGMAFVMGTNEKWGATNGETVIPFEFGYIIGFQEGLSAFIGENHLYGFIDEVGNQVVPPVWKFAYSFHNGLACVEDSNDLCGFIDKKGNVAIPCQWAVAERFYDSPSFTYVMDEQNNWFKIDRQGNVVCQFGPNRPCWNNNQLVQRK